MSDQIKRCTVCNKNSTFKADGVCTDCEYKRKLKGKDPVVPPKKEEDR